MNKLVILFVMLSLSGCASLPANYGKPAKGSKIGVVYMIDKSPVFYHVGTTAFQNDVNKNISTTDFHAKFESKINTPLLNIGFSVDSLDAPQQLMEQKYSLFSYVDLNNKVKTILDDLALKSNLDFIIIVYPNSGPAWANSSAYLEGYGLYTRCSLGSCNAYALDYIDARIYDVKNKTSLKGTNSVYFNQKIMPNLIVPDNIEDINSAQIDEAGELALAQFLIHFNAMLAKSEFL